MPQRSEASYERLAVSFEHADDLARRIGLLDSTTVALAVIKRLDDEFEHPSALVDRLWEEAAAGDTSNVDAALLECTTLVRPFLTDEEEPEELEGREELLCRAAFVVADTATDAPLKERLIKASTGLLDVYQYVDELLRLPTSSSDDVGPTEAFGLERLLTAFETLATAPSAQAVPAVRVLTMRGAEVLSHFFDDLQLGGRLEG